MTEPYHPSLLRIREDLAAAHTRAWQHIARPGTWWDGATRVAIAAETRHAPSCTLCQRRKAALSPLAITGAHEDLGRLPEPVVEVVHRVRTDPGRLGEQWYRGVTAGELSEEQYVESLVPEEVRSFFDLVTNQYLPGPAMRDFAQEYRAISHAQIELLAARVSALNRCLY